MRCFNKLLPLVLCALFSFLAPQNVQAQSHQPDIAYDAMNNRYLMVWEEEISPGNFQVFGRFRNPDGTQAGTENVRLTPDRPTQGCFYPAFDTDNNDVTTPTNCTNRNPSVAYNNGQYVIAWEVSGTAAAPTSSPDNQFSGIFIRVLDAGTLAPRPGFEEGLHISKVQVAANNNESSCGDKHACNDSQILAWGQAINPDVAPRSTGGGFVVTWQSNKDYIGCADPARRQAWAVYGRYVDQSFTAGSTTNPPVFSVFKDDSTMNTEVCEPAANVDSGTNPRIAYNQSSNDFVIAYQVQRADGGNASIGAKRVTLNTSNAGEVAGSFMPDVVAFIDGQSLQNPDLVSFHGNYILAASNGTDIFAKSFTSGSITPTAPTAIALGTGTKTNPRLATSAGIGGTRPSGANPDPERIGVAFERGGNVHVALLNDTLAVAKPPTNMSTSIATNNGQAELASDLHDFVISWHGINSGDKVFAGFLDSAEAPTNNPPTTPTLGAQPANGVTWAPTRLYISWTAVTDPDAGDTVSYQVYFAEGASEGAVPYKSGITDTDFIIQASTDNRAAYNPDAGVTAVFLEPSSTYTWKVCAVDNHDAASCTAPRTFNTDDSVMGWWRFDENPAGPVCSGGGAGETVCDYSGKGNHGVPMGGPTWLPPAGDILGRALDFDGVNDKVEVQNDATIGVGTGVTLSCRVKPVGVGAIINKDGPMAGPYYIIVSPSNMVTFGTFTSSMYREVNGDFSGLFGSYFRATGIYTGPAIELYINQTLQGSTPTPGTVANNNNILKFGFTPPSTFHNGSIDECLIINRNLDAGEISSLTNADL